MSLKKSVLVGFILGAIFVGGWPASSFALTMTPTIQPGTSATWPAGTTHPFVPFVSQTDDPLGFLEGKSVYFRGFLQGGSPDQLLGAHLIYRIRLDFDELATIGQLSLLCAGDNVSGGSNAVFRLLDSSMNVIDAVTLTGFNSLGNFVLNGAGATGNTFYIDQFDYSTEWRYLENLSINFARADQPVPEPSTVLLLGSGLAAVARYRRRLLE